MKWNEPLAGLYEAALVLNTTKQQVINWRNRRPDFPEPKAQLKMGPVWLTEDLLKWKR